MHYRIVPVIDFRCGMKRTLLLVSAVTVVACNNKTPQPGQKKNTVEQAAGVSMPHEGMGQEESNRIVAGKQVGKIRLGITGEELVKTLGLPDESDAAMGKAWLSYKGKAQPETELWVYTAYSDTSMRYKTVQFVRTNSAYFKTDEKVGAGSTYADLRKAYPRLKKVARRAEGKNGIALYDNGNGIAFEVTEAANETRCTAVLVYESSRRLLDIYRTK